MNLSTYQHSLSTCTLPSKDLLCLNLDLDLKSWFHYMAVHPTNRRRMRFNTEAYPYDEYNVDNWTMLLKLNKPYWAPRLLKIALDLIRTNFPEVTVIWYLDDISILGETELLVEGAACALIYFLKKLGVDVDDEESMKQTADWSNYLQEEGITFSTGTVSSPLN